MGDSKQRRYKDLAINQARRTKQDQILKSEPCTTWSSTHPAYAGTSLAARPQVPARKECRRCGKVYDVVDTRVFCGCGGYLYVISEYVQPGKGVKGFEKKKKD